MHFFEILIKPISMKKITMFFQALTILGFAAWLTSCDDEETKQVFDSPSFTVPNSTAANVAEATAIAVTAIGTPGGFATLTAEVVTKPTNSTVTATPSALPTLGSTTGSATVSVVSDTEGLVIVQITVTDQQDPAKSTSKTVAIEVVRNLLAAPTLTSVDPEGTVNVLQGGAKIYALTLNIPGGFGSAVAETVNSSSSVTVGNFASNVLSITYNAGNTQPQGLDIITVTVTDAQTPARTSTFEINVNVVPNDLITTTNFSIGAGILELGAGGFVATPTPLGTSTIAIRGNISSNYTFESDKLYVLDGTVAVAPGATLTIEAGSKVYGNPDPNRPASILAVQRGAKIQAVGTVANVVELTSIYEHPTVAALAGIRAAKPGDWAGLIVCGNATNNIKNDDPTSSGFAEGTNFAYGGPDDSDNSGTLQYVRVKYAGEFISSTEDLNGISMFGVGSGTVVDHIQVYRGADDGIEFFGGTVDIKYAVVTNSVDDQFDYTQGWRGRAQFLVSVQDQAGDCAFECDNNENGPANRPYSGPKISNVTVIGVNNVRPTRSFRLRNGNQRFSYHNALIVGADRGISVEGAELQADDAAGLVKFTNSYIADVPAADQVLTAASGSTIQADATILRSQSIPTLTNGFVGVISTGSVNPNTALGTWFTSVDFIGAADPNATSKWWTGWVLDSSGNVIQ